MDVIQNRAGGMHQVQHSAEKHHNCGERDSEAKHVANLGLHLLIGEWLHQILPVMPLKIISRPSATMTTPKTIFSVATLAFTNRCDPIIEPPRTPSITGIAIAGSI